VFGSIRSNSSPLEAGHYLRKSAIYGGGIVRRAHCKGRALPAELSARVGILADLLPAVYPPSERRRRRAKARAYSEI